MTEQEPQAQRPRWPKGQRFQLSAAGREAGVTYRAAITASRAEAGRASFDAANSDWAKRLNIESADGLYFGEMQKGPRTIDEMVASLEGCGPARSDIRTAVDRLVKLQLLEPVIPPPAPPPAPRRW